MKHVLNSADIFTETVLLVLERLEAPSRGAPTPAPEITNEL